MTGHFLQVTSIVQQNSDENDSFLMWFCMNVRWWDILLQVTSIVSTELCIREWFISNVILYVCSMVRHSLQVTSIVQQNSNENDSFLMWFCMNVRWWDILSKSPSIIQQNSGENDLFLMWFCIAMFDRGTYSPSHLHSSNRTLLRMIHFKCDCAMQCSTVEHFLEVGSIVPQNSS